MQTTCYGCPTVQPTPDNPTPPQNVAIGGVRHRLPTNCSTPVSHDKSDNRERSAKHFARFLQFFDPVGNRCLCTADDCAFTDETREIGMLAFRAPETTRCSPNPHRQLLDTSSHRFRRRIGTEQHSHRDPSTDCWRRQSQDDAAGLRRCWIARCRRCYLSMGIG